MSHSTVKKSKKTAVPAASKLPVFAQKKGAFLGNIAKVPTPPGNTGLPSVFSLQTSIKYPEDLVGSQLEKWVLQSVARSCLGNTHRTASCMRNRQYKKPDVQVKYSLLRKRSFFGNLQTCGSVWSCPICAQKISESRRNTLITLVDRHLFLKSSINPKLPHRGVYLITRTVPHTVNQPAKLLMQQMAKAESKYKSGAPWKRLVEKFGIIGSVRSVEVTYGANGWHPHIHELVFTEEALLVKDKKKYPLERDDLDDLKEDLYKRWKSAAVRGGFAEPSFENGVDVKDGTYATRYVSKWGIESELTKWHLKKGYKSFGPFDFLRIAQDGGPLALTARALFIEYSEAFKGVRQLHPTPGLYALYDLNVEEEKTDEELAQGNEEGARLLASLTENEWKCILREGLRGPLLAAVDAAEGGLDSVETFLMSHSITKNTDAVFGKAKQ